MLLLLLQMGVWTADSLLAEGKLSAAESAYYAEARARPRSPVARAALGKFIAARGGTRAGAVLIDEARFFGGDSAALARALVPLYVRLGDYKELVALTPNVLTSAERQRARWLSTRPSEARLRDSVVLVSYRPLADGRGMGTVFVRVGKSEFPAIIDARVSGLVLPAAARADVRPFGAQGRNTLAVADSARIGGVTFANVPVLIGSPDETARIGFDVLAPYFPGFDPTKGLLTLRRVNRRSPSPVGLRTPALYDDNGMRLLIGGRWHPSTAASASMLLATRRWIWDGKLGDVVLLQ
jgi:hypothetical protein